MIKHECAMTIADKALKVVFDDELPREHARWVLTRCSDRVYGFIITYCPFCGEELKPPEPEIEPCPFCGHYAELRGGGSEYYYIRCSNCNASGPLGSTSETAAKNWNDARQRGRDDRT
jgi:Lar family restriction alleviation protein